MAQPWNYNETSEYVSSCEALGLTSEFKEKLRTWAVTVSQTPTPRLKPFFISPQNIFQIWVAGIANPDANKGKSGGYRLIFIIYIPDNSIHVDKMEERKELGFKTEGKNKKVQNHEYLEELKASLMKKWCSDL